jgi:hypothetical protein
MAFTGKHPVRSKILIYDTPIEQVNRFNYLGCTISIFENKDLETKLRKFNHPSGTIRRELNKKTWKERQIKFYKVMAVPTLTYNSETWTLTKKQRQKIETAEIKFLRNVTRYTLKDKIRNTMIRNELKIFSVNNRIQNNRLNWINHVARMDPERFHKQLMDYTPRGTRSIGRPKSRWKDQPIQQRNGTERIERSKPRG